MVTLEEGMDIRTINSWFLVVPCINVYNHILGRPLELTFYVMASPVHLKLKYHNIHDNGWW